VFDNPSVYLLGVIGLTTDRKPVFMALAVLVATSLFGGSTSSARGSTNGMVQIWHEKCFYHICKGFPYVAEFRDPQKRGPFNKGVRELPAGTSPNGKGMVYESRYYSDIEKYGFCVTVNCRRAEFYTVSVFRSQFTDPMKALTAIAVVKNPVKIKTPVWPAIQAAVRFTNRLYQSPGLAIYFKGRVYLMQTRGQDERIGAVVPQYTDSFLSLDPYYFQLH
jgi:hypothetical protein